MKKNQELTRTGIFAAVAAVAVVAAFAVDRLSQPEEIKEYEMVGEAFFPDFTEPGKVKALEVHSYDEDSGKVVNFEVAYEDKAWRLKSYLDYPAEADERLAKTAASMIGIERAALAGRRENQYAKFGVEDPTNPNLEDPSTAGSLIVLKDEDGEVLAKYIIGKKVDGTGEDEEDTPDDDIHAPAREAARAQYYVRVPSDTETETYRAFVTLDLSTKFEDWIDPDLLQVESNDIVDLQVKNYQADVQNVIANGRIRQQVVMSKEELNHLKKDGFSWELEGLDEENEEFESQKARDLVSKIDGFKIVGVRKKYQYNDKPILTAELKLDAELIESAPDPNEVFGAAYDDLNSKGFILRLDRESPETPGLLANDGELIAATNKGVVYHMYYGSEVVGSDTDIQIGSSTEADEKKEDESKDDDDKDDSGIKKNRYVFLRVGFDESHIPDKPEHPGEAPVKPAAPEAPAEDAKDKDESKESENGEDAKTTEERSDVSSPDDSDESSCDEAETADEDKAADKPADASSDDETKPANDAPKTDDEKSEDGEAGKDNTKEEAPKEKTPQELYEEALKQFATDKAEYDRKLDEYNEKTKEFEGKVKEGKEIVARLSERFGDWFYVISSDSFEGLQLTRAELVKPKEKEEDDKDEKKGETESDDKKTDDAKPGDADSKPKAKTEPAKPEAPGSETSKPDTTKPADSPDDSDKPSDSTPPKSETSTTREKSPTVESKPESSETSPSKSGVGESSKGADEKNPAVEKKDDISPAKPDADDEKKESGE